MCATCGCGSNELHGEGAAHDHAHPHPHGARTRAPPRQALRSPLLLEQAVLAKNDALAARVRARFAERGALAVNLVSSPGAGKTRLLERTIRDLGRALKIQVIEGDQATDHDADRVRAAGAPAFQVNTGTGCHLDAQMIERALDALPVEHGATVLIENVGNLVCPSMFDLGELAKVVIASVTEGEDKPIKYPHMFRASSVMVLNKIDLLPHLDFDVDRCLRFAREVNPKLEVFQLSAQTGEGLEGWYGWLRERHQQTSGQRTSGATS